MRLATILALALNTACNRAPEQLERPRVTAEQDAAGLVSVEGSGRDHELRVDDAIFDLFTPGELDLSVLDGRDLELDLRNGGSSLVALDDGEPVYVLGRSTLYTPFEAQMYHGDEVNSERRDGQRVRYYQVDLDTDDGTIALLPGEEAFVRIDGDLWQLVVLQAYTSSDTHVPGMPQPKCGGFTWRLDFEALRVEDEAEPRFLEAQGPFEPDAASGC